LSSPFFAPLPSILPVLVALLFAVVVLACFLNCGSELLFPSTLFPINVELINLFFLGVVIRFSLEEVLSLSVAYVDN